MLTAEALVKNSPLIYHMSAPGSWPSIRKHGLLSTSALLDLFEYEGETRYQIECCRRSDWVTLNHSVHENVSIRDQWPLSDSGLRKALPRDMRPACWYKILNNMVFFFPCKERIKRMLMVYKNKEIPCWLLIQRVLLKLTRRKSIDLQ